MKVFNLFVHGNFVVRCSFLIIFAVTSLQMVGCSERLTTEKAQEAMNKWMTDYPGSVEVQSVYLERDTVYGKLKFNNFVYRDFRGELTDFSGDGTARFDKEHAVLVLSTVWVGEQDLINVAKPKAADKADTFGSDDKDDEKMMTDDAKILAQGNFSRFSSPFFVIARDTSTYAALREITPGLPDVEVDYFKSNTIVAAFLGGCTTGGYSVRLTRTGRNVLRAEGNGLSVREIVNQDLTQPTQPYQIISMPLGQDENIEISEQLMSQYCGYKTFNSFEVKSGEFETDIDSSGQREKFQLIGDFNIFRSGNLVTLSYYFAESGGQERKLSGKATGILQSDGKFIIAPIGAGTFIKQPHNLLRLTGKFQDSLGVTTLKTEEVSDLSISLESLPTKVSGSLSGKGKLEAKQMEPQ